MASRTEIRSKIAEAQRKVAELRRQQTSGNTASSYTGGSIVDYLNSSGRDSSYASRSALAGSNGIANYTGSASQNTQLLNALRNVGIVTPPRTQQQDLKPYTPPQQDYTGGPYNMSDYGLVRFTGEGPQGYLPENIVWLVDSSNKTLRPFESDSALRNFFDGEVPVDSIKTLDASVLGEGGILGPLGEKKGFQPLTNAYSIKNDGSARKLDFSNTQLQEKYGSPMDLSAEQTMYSALNGMMKIFEGAGLDKNTINRVTKNTAQMAFYVSAMTYGGYSIGDVYSDLKKREMGITDLTPISPVASKQEYVSTSDYQNASGDTRIMPPSSLGPINSQQMDLAVYKLPDELFKTLIPLRDQNSPEFKAEMDKIETSYYDVMQQQLNATTEQEKAIADYNYNEWKKKTEDNLGIQLSNNSLEAWSQVQNAYGQYNQKGIYGSGIQNENIDTYLRKVRKNDTIARDQTQSAKDKTDMQYFLTTATTDQIKQLVSDDPAKAKMWGLVPSDEVKNSLSLSALRQKYPNAKESDLSQYISIILDENGNYRSKLYQNKMGTFKDLNPSTAGFNTLGISTIKDQVKQDKVYKKSLAAEKKAYKPYTISDSPFTRAGADGLPAQKQYKPAVFKTTNFADKINKAVGSSVQGNKTSSAQFGTQRKSIASQLSNARKQVNALSKNKAFSQPTNQPTKRLTWTKPNKDFGSQKWGSSPGAQNKRSSMAAQLEKARQMVNQLSTRVKARRK